MARTTEFIKRQEARIIIFLCTAENHLKDLTSVSNKLKIDYSYLVKLLQGMYEKGWVMTHKYNNETYINITAQSPIKEANKRIIGEQTTLKEQ